MKKIIPTVLLIVIMTLTATAQYKMDMGEKSPLRKLQIAELAITNLYVDSVDEQKLVEDAIRGMLEKLDPHSSYLNAKEVKSTNESLNGNFEGIGVQFNMMEDTMVVLQTITDGPSEKVGILAGDRIVAVDDTVIAGVKMAREEIMRRLRGPKGTRVVLKVVRPEITDTLTFKIIRDKIPVKTIDAAYMLRPALGYIRISSFGANTYDEFMECMDKLRAQGMEALVLDLQENGGGYLAAGVDIANEFLHNGDLIVYTDGRNNSQRQFRANHDGSFTEGKVYVLVDSYTASAAEIVTGAIQDHDRGLVVGRRTFGKGLVQRPVPMPDGSMIRLTVSHYYTPSGRCIQKPYTKGDNKDYNMDMTKRLKSGELTSADSIHFADSLKCYTLKKHRTVYGGGGIMPDHFVPLDTTRYTKFHRELVAKSLILNANLRYIDGHRKELKKAYPDFATFKEKYSVPQSVIDGLLAEGKAKGITPKDDEELEMSLSQIRVQLKALIARDLWEMTEYFSVMNEENDVVKKVLELHGE
ncbi:MAG: S41 family peptidase [Prevotella sp.]